VARKENEIKSGVITGVASNNQSGRRKKINGAAKKREKAKMKK